MQKKKIKNILKSFKKNLQIISNFKTVKLRKILKMFLIMVHENNQNHQNNQR